MGHRLVEGVVRRGPVCERHDLFRCLPRIVKEVRQPEITCKRMFVPSAASASFAGPGQMTVCNPDRLRTRTYMKQGGHNEAALFRIAPPDRHCSNRTAGSSRFWGPAL